MKLREIKLDTRYPGYGEGAVPGIGCEVTLQVGDRYTATVTIALTDDQTAEVVAKAVELALTHLTFDPASIDVKGNPGKPRPPAEPASDVKALADMEPL
jgi:hypothetical protein